MNAGMKPPSDVVELLQRLFPPASAGESECRPFVATAAALDDDGVAGEPTWVIVESVTSDLARLSHPQPLSSRQLLLSVYAEGGEVLRMILEVVATTSSGSMFETTARFLR